MSFRSLIVFFFLVCFVPRSGWCETLVEPIRELYQRAAYAAQLKYIDGLLAHRSAHFRLYNSQGEALDLSAEQRNFRQLLKDCLSLEFHCRIVKLDVQTPQRVVCHVEQYFEVERPEKAGDSTFWWLECEAVDEWTKSPKGWSLRTTRLKERRLRRKPKLNGAPRL